MTTIAAVFCSKLNVNRHSCGSVAPFNVQHGLFLALISPKPLARATRHYHHFRTDEVAGSGRPCSFWDSIYLSFSVMITDSRAWICVGQETYDLPVAQSKKQMQVLQRR